VVRIQVIVGGDHGDTAFQFGASVSVDLTGDRIIEFEVSVCELICRKDTCKSIESTILTRLTQGLEIVAMWNLNIDVNDEGGEECKFSKDTRSIHSHIVDIYVTGDLAFQAMALGKESMSGWWCMLCKASRRLAGNVGDMSPTCENVANFRSDMPISATCFLLCQSIVCRDFSDTDVPPTEDFWLSLPLIPT
jgi:hypothetical protein